MPTTKAAPALPEEWEEMLTRMEQFLGQAEAETAKHEQELNAAPAQDATASQTDWQARLQHWDALVLGMQAFAQQSEQKAAETSAALRESEEGLRGWLTTAVTIRQRLADWDRATMTRRGVAEGHPIA